MHLASPGLVSSGGLRLSFQRLHDCSASLGFVVFWSMFDIISEKVSNVSSDCILTLHYVKHVRQRLWHVRNAMPEAASIGRVWRRLCTWIAMSNYFAKTRRLAEAIWNLASWYRVLTLLRVALPPWSSLAWFQDVSRLFTLQSSGAFATWERPACFHQECHHTPGVKFTDRHCFAWGTGRLWPKEV